MQISGVNPVPGFGLYDPYPAQNVILFVQAPVAIEPLNFIEIRP